MGSNPFESYADQAVPQAVQRRERQKELRQAERVKEQQDEQAILNKMARAQETAWTNSVIEGCEDPDAMRSILGWLDRSGAHDAGATISMIEEAAKIFKGTDARHLIVKRVDKACMRIRRKMGLREIDDPIPPDTNVFFTCKGILDRDDSEGSA